MALESTADLAFEIAQQCHKELLKTQNKVSRLMEKVEQLKQEVKKCKK